MQTETKQPGYTPYEASTKVKSQIARSFTYHAPNSSQAERYTLLRAHAKAFAELIAQVTPESREQSLALTSLEETVMHANAAIARNEGEKPPTV